MNINFRTPNFIQLQRESFVSFVMTGIADEIKKISPIQCENSQERIEVRFYPKELKYRLPQFTPELQKRIVAEQLKCIALGFTREQAELHVKLFTDFLTREYGPAPEQFRLQGQTYSMSITIPVQIFSYPKQGMPRQSRRTNIFLGDIPFMTSRGTFIINGSSRVVVNQIIRSPGVYFKTHIDAKDHKIYTASILSKKGSWLRFEIDRDGLVWARIDKIRKIPIHILLYSLGISPSEVNESVRYSEFLDGSRLAYNKKARKNKIEELEDSPRIREICLKKLHLHFRCIYPYSFKEGSNLLNSRFMDPARYDLTQLGRTRLNKKLGLSGNPTTTILRTADILGTVNYLVSLHFGKGSLDDIDDLKNRRVRTSGELIQEQLSVGLSRLERIVREKIAYPRAGEVRTLAEKYTPGALINSKPLLGTMRQFFGSSQLSQYMDQVNPLAEITHKRRISSLGPGGLHKDRAGMAVRDIHPSHYGKICPIETPEGGNAGLVSSLAIYARTDNSGYLQSPFYRVEKSQVKKEEGLYYLSSKTEENFTISPGDLVLSKTNHFEQAIVPIRSKKEFTSAPPEFVQFMAISPIQMISVATSLIPFLEHDDANRVLMGSNMQRQAVPLLQPEKPFVGTGLEGQIARDSGTVMLASVTGQVVHVEAGAITILPVVNRAKRQFASKVILHSLQGYQRSNQATCMYQRPAVKPGDWVKKGDLLADGSATAQGELALGKNILVAYMPWEGYNFEDAVLVSERLVYDNIYTSIHIERYQTSPGKKENFTCDIPSATPDELRRLDSSGIIKIGSWVEPGSVLVGKVTLKSDTDETPEERLLRAIFLQKPPEFFDSSFRVPNGGVKGRVIDIREYNDTVRVYIAENRNIQIGDKVAGRHGNKGIISNILPIQDMPFLPDGTPVDMVLNPLGVPSRMNVGQVYECLLGLAAKELGQLMKVMPFDEMYGQQASRGLVYQKLYEARVKTGKDWLLQPAFAGKSRIFDGRTGEAFHQPVLAGYPYVLKLIHQVDDKIHARSTGPYSLVTQQPLGGRAKHGGQRFGEMEVWALEGFGAAYTLQELLTIKSDDMKGRNETLRAMIKGVPLPTPGFPESFIVLLSELRALCIDFRLL